MPHLLAIIWIIVWPLTCSIEEYIYVMRNRLIVRESASDDVFALAWFIEISVCIWIAYKLW